MPNEPLTKNLQFEKKNKDMIKLPKCTPSPSLYFSSKSPPSTPHQFPANNTPIPTN